MPLLVTPLTGWHLTMKIPLVNRREPEFRKKIGIAL
jgi:hypothetical protein